MINSVVLDRAIYESTQRGKDIAIMTWPKENVIGFIDKDQVNNANPGGFVAAWVIDGQIRLACESAD